MSFFDFVTTSSGNDSKWNSLNNQEQLDELIRISSLKPQLIFKHSTRCGVSRMALKHVEKNLLPKYDDVDFHFLDILENRQLSNTVAEHFEISHESPQLLLIKNGKPVNYASHYAILDMKI